MDFYQPKKKHKSSYIHHIISVIFSSILPFITRTFSRESTYNFGIIKETVIYESFAELEKKK